MPSKNYVRWFREIGMQDVPLVGGKTASLGELYRAFAEAVINVPNGFGVTADAYRDALHEAGVVDELRRLVEGVKKDNVHDLSQRAAAARKIVYEATGPAEIRDQLGTAYRALEKEYGKNVAVAVRSSATA